MAIKKVVEIDVDVVRANGGLENFTQNFKKSEEAAKSLRTQLREAQAEVGALSDKFGATSKEAVEAAKRAAQLKDRIGDAKSLTEAFNPDAKFKALSGALTGVAGGFSVVTGLMGTLGTESKEVEGAILKVQSAMAIASGAQALGESIDSFKQLGAVVKSFSIVQKISAAAQMVWNAAMAANPIGAIVAVVVALIAAGYALVKMFIASSEATQKAEMANKALNKELDTQVKNQKLATQEADLSRDAQLKMAKASGKSSEEIRKLSLELANQEVAQKMANAQTLRAIAIEAMRVAGMKDATDAEKETAKNALKAFNEANDALKASVLNRRKLIIDNRVAEVQEATDAREKEKEKQNKHNEELLKNQEKAAKEKLELEKKLAAEFLAFKVAVNKAELDLKFQLQKDADDVEKSLIVETPQQKLDREFQEKKAILEADNRSTLELQSQYIAASELISQQATDKKNETDAANKEAEKRREEEVARLKEEQYRTNLDNLQTILSAGGKKLAGVSKALAIADIIRSSYKSISATISSTGEANAKAVAASPLTGGQPFVSINTIQAALSIGANVASAARSIKAITSDSSSAPSGGGQTAGGGGGGSAPAPPQFNIVGQSSTNQLSQTIAGQQNRPIQTYVVGNQVSTQQSLDRNAVATSTFG